MSSIQTAHHPAVSGLTCPCPSPLSRDAILELLQTRCLAGMNLHNAQLSGMDLSGIDLSRADLSGADLSQANLAGANLRNADLSHARLAQANLSDACLNGASLGEANLAYSLCNNANFLGSMLYRCDFTGASLRWAVLTHTYAVEAIFDGSDLGHGDLRWSNLSRASLELCDLQTVRLNQALLRSTAMDNQPPRQSPQQMATRTDVNAVSPSQPARSIRQRQTSLVTA